MTKEQQDLAWTCLPKEYREELKRLYNDGIKHNKINRVAIYKSLFGYHNLTSDTEPDEMLMVERSKVQEIYHQIKLELGDGGCSEYQDDINMEKESLLKYLFGDKCLHDTPNTPEFGVLKPKPKFKVGDIVLNVYCKRERLTIAEICPILKNGNQQYRVKEYPYLWNECELELYTEENKETMEEKELNLCELLKGCEGEEFYLLDCGNATLDGIQTNNSRGDSIKFLSLHSTNFDSGTIIINPNGKRKVFGSAILYPSRAFYEKYPLDAYSAWMEWKEARKPKRWRAKQYEKYWYLDRRFIAKSCIAGPNESFDNTNYENGNYFRTKEEAEQATEAVKEALQKFHEQNLKK